MKKLVLYFSIYLLLTHSIVAQELTQVKPACDSSVQFSNDPPPSPQPVIYEASKELQPTILKMVKPEYTEEAKTLGVYGTILASMVFRTDGKIALIRILRTLPGGLAEQVVRAAQQIQFKPATKNGALVSVRMKVEFPFVLSDLDQKQIANILEREFWYLSPPTIQELAKDYTGRKLNSAMVEKLPHNDEEAGINLLTSDEKSEYLILREEGITNLCLGQQKSYLELQNKFPQLLDTHLSAPTEPYLSDDVKQLFRLRQEGLKTLPIEKQKRFVELYNHAVLLGHNLQPK